MLEITQAADSEPTPTLPPSHPGHSPYGQLIPATAHHNVSPSSGSHPHPSGSYVPGHSRGLSNGSNYSYAARDTQPHRIERSPGMDEKMISAVTHRRQSYSNAQQMPPSDSQQAATRHAAQLASQTHPQSTQHNRGRETVLKQQYDSNEQERRKRIKRTPSPSISAQPPIASVSGQRTGASTASANNSNGMLRLRDFSPPRRTHPGQSVSSSSYPPTSSSSSAHRNAEYGRTSTEQSRHGPNSHASTSRRVKRGLDELEEDEDVEMTNPSQTSANSRSARAASALHQSHVQAQTRVPGRPRSLSPLEGDEGEVVQISANVTSRVSMSPRIRDERSLGMAESKERPASPYASVSKNDSPRSLASSASVRTSAATPLLKGDSDRDRERWEAALNKKRGVGSGTHSPPERANEVEPAR